MKANALTRVKTEPVSEKDFAVQNTPAIPRLAYTVTEAAQAIGVRNITIYRALQRGLLHASSHCRHKLVSAESLAKFIQE